MEVEELDLDIADDICIKTRSELWPVMFFISHFENTKDFNFRTVVFLEDWFVCFFIFAQFCKW